MKGVNGLRKKLLPERRRRESAGEGQQRIGKGREFLLSSRIIVAMLTGILSALVLMAAARMERVRGK